MNMNNLCRTYAVLKYDGPEIGWDEVSNLNTTGFYQLLPRAPVVHPIAMSPENLAVPIEIRLEPKGITIIAVLNGLDIDGMVCRFYEDGTYSNGIDIMIKERKNEGYVWAGFHANWPSLENGLAGKAMINQPVRRQYDPVSLAAIKDFVVRGLGMPEAVAKAA